jgi:hypothetical protein
MTAFWSALAASLISASAALTGVWFSNRDHLRRHRETLREEALRGQRDLVADTLLAGREWHALQETLLPARARMSMDDLTEFVETDTAVRMRDVTKELQVALTRANLFLADNELRQVVKALTDFIETFPDVIVGPIMKERTVEAVGLGLRGMTQFRLTVRRLEDLAVERLPHPVWHNSKT